jgi:hypothetical protein
MLAPLCIDQVDTKRRRVSFSENSRSFGNSDRRKNLHPGRVSPTGLQKLRSHFPVFRCPLAQEAFD